MDTSLSSDQWKHLLKFIGYGRLDAPVWFLGMEEAGGDPHSMRVRTEFAPVEDLKIAHAKIGQFKHHQEPRKIQRVWNRMCGIMLEIERRPNELPHRLDYQADELGRVHGQTLLLELLPIPSKSIKVWNHQHLDPEGRTREQYEVEVLDDRIKLIQGLLGPHNPQVVVCHGKKAFHVQAWRRIFGMEFEPVRDIPEFSDLAIAQYWLIADDGVRCVLITQNFSRLNNFRLAFPAIARIIRHYGHDAWVEDAAKSTP